MGQSEGKAKLSRKRNSIEISAEILRVAMSGVRKSHIVYKVNLNFKIVNKYLDHLVRSGLITVSSDRNRIFSTTDKGHRYLDNFEAFESLLKSSNLM